MNNIRACRGGDQYVVRFPDGLRDKVRQEAARNGRSMNSEILYQLATAYQQTEKATEHTA